MDVRLPHHSKNMTYPNLSLPELVERAQTRVPDRPALIYFGGAITYAQLARHVARVAAALHALGVTKGDRVALMMPNCPQFVIAFFAALRAGAIVTATSAMYTAREVEHQWRDAGVKLAIVDRHFQRIIRAVAPQVSTLQHVVRTGLRQYAPAQFARLDRQWHTSPAAAPGTTAGRPHRLRSTGVQSHEWTELLEPAGELSDDGPQPSDIACLQYTGGTTGISKGAILTHRNLVTNAAQAMNWLTGGAEREETFVASLPLFHIYALTCVMISSIYMGGCTLLLPRFQLRAALNLIRKYRPTIYHGVPTMYVAFNNTPNVRRYGFDSLRVCMSGGGPLPVEVKQKFEALTGGKLVEGYGLTETSPVTHINPLTGTPRVGSIGLPIADTEARIMDLVEGGREMPVGEIGEIAIRGPQVMQGYWNKPEETAQVLREGWFYTGDVARKDADGFYYNVDRKKDMIIAGGYNIYPREVEEVLFECPKVKEAVVIGVPDGYRGETVKAFIVLKDGMSATAEEVIGFCRGRIANYKIPRLVTFRDSLPKSGVGKYLRRELRNL